MAKHRRRAFGMIRKLPSGRFQASFVDPDGRRRYGPSTFERRSEASDWLTVQQSLLVTEQWVDPDRGKVAFGPYAARWIEERPGLRPRTVGLYQWLLGKYLEPTLGSKFLSDVTPAAVRRWRMELLGRGVSESMVAKSYRLLRAIMNTAVEHDELIRRNPCRLKGAGEESPAERPVLTLPEIVVLAEAMPERFRSLILVTTFASLRFGEVTALTRADVDLESGVVRVRRAFTEVKGEGLVPGLPKSRAGFRVVALPDLVVDELHQHMQRFVGTHTDALLFTGPKGAPLRRGNFNPLVGWRDAVAGIGRPGLRFHDLRHTGNTLAAGVGVSTRDLMVRMGHDSMQAALMYQHATDEASSVIAKGLDEKLRKTRKVVDEGGQETLFGGSSDAG